MLPVASRITGLFLNSIPYSGIHTLTIFGLNPLEKLVAWSTPRLGAYLCNYECPEQPLLLKDR